MKTRNKILWASLILALIYIIFLKGCGNKHQCPEQETLIIEVDTVINVTVIDTVFREVKEYTYITVKINEPYYDTIPVPRPVTFNDIAETNFDYLMKFPAIYTDTISNDTISLFYSAKVRGYLDDLTLGYKIFTPYVIKEVTTIKTEVIKKKAFNGFYLGMDVGITKNGLTHVSPMLEVSTAKTNYNAGFDLMDNSVIVGARFKLGK